MTLSFATLTLCIHPVGDDISILISGGKDHIGCTVLAIPRPSLTGNGSISCTSSVLNVTGHKDEVICRLLAERYASKYNAVTVCTGGFHIDHISKEQIKELVSALENLEI